jgi:ArsR family transcriptional regulator
MARSKPIPIATDKARLAAMLKALGNPIRFKIVEYLAEHQTCQTQQIVQATPLAQSTVSQHLKVLRESGLIIGEIDGPATCYCLNPEAILWLKEQIGAWLPECCAVVSPVQTAGSPEEPCC